MSRTAQADTPWAGNNIGAGTAANFIFGLGPGAPARFDPTHKYDGGYQFNAPRFWPTWGGPSNADLLMGDYEGPPSTSGMCSQGVIYGGHANQICGGLHNWGETEIEVWRLAD